MHFYQFNIGDYAKKTQHLTNEEDLAYRRLLDMYYDSELPIPIDIPKVARRLRIDPAALAIVLDEFFISTAEGWLNPRCSQDIETYKARAETAKENGKKAAKTRYQNGDYMAHAGSLYAVRVDSERVKVGISGNLKSRVHQLRAKYGSGATLEHFVDVSHMGDAEAELLQVYAEKRTGELIPLPESDIDSLKAHMNRIAVAYTSHGSLATNQEPITTKHKPSKPKDAGNVTVAVLLADGCSEIHANELLSLREKKRSPLTALAWNGIKGEIKKAGMSLDEGIGTMAARGWQSFEAAWVAPSKAQLSTVVPTQARTCIHCKEPAHMEISGRWYCRNHDQYSTSEAA